MFDLGDAPVRFRRVLATLCDITSRLPSAIVVISCLENFFDEVKRHLTQPIARRVTAGPGPVELPAACDRDQVVALIGRRLESLYRSAGVPYHAAEPTYPLPDALVRAARRPRRARCPRRGPAATASVASRKGRWSSTLLMAATARASPPRRGAGARAEDRGGRAGLERDPIDVRDRGALRRVRAGGDPGRGDRRRARASSARATAGPSRRRRTAASSGSSDMAPIGRRAVAGGRVQQRTAGRRPGPSDRRGRPARRRDRAGDRALDRVPRQREVGGGAAAPQAGRRRRPPRGRRGLGLADDDGPVAVPLGPRVRTRSSPPGSGGPGR